jgi:uncharacterized membrane protein YebE (DUF533 family)
MSERVFERAERDYLLTAVKVWAAAAWADGVLVESEKMTMNAIIQAGKLTDEQRATARGFLDKKVTLDDVDLAAIPAGEKLHIYVVACGMVAFDKDVASAEKGFLDRLGKALGISDADAAKARTGAGV